MKVTAYLSFIKRHFRLFILLSTLFSLIFPLGQLIYFSQNLSNLKTQINLLSKDKLALNEKLEKTSKELQVLKNQDQYKRNEKLQETIGKIENTYKKSISTYEKLLDLKTQAKNTGKFDEQLAQAINFLSLRNYASGDATLETLNSQIDTEKAKIAALVTPNSQNNPATVSNTLPTNGYSFQSVRTDLGTFNVAIVTADLNTARVIVDTASESDCSNNCPALSLADYVSRNNAFAGINGSFFCPPEYPSCAGKTNSFDTLLMNKNKRYFNSDNNKYSTVPLVYFSGNSMGVRNQSLDWGRDTGIDSVLANFPLYIVGGNSVFGGSADAKLTNKGPRTFVANKGNFAYIGIIYNATSDDAAKVLKTLGVDNALGLDQGGSTALWFSGYKAGPGRNIPNALLFVRK